MEQLKHECGVAMIRLLKPLDYYKEKYGSYAYALGKLYLLMEKQHNRGQEAAGVGVMKLHAIPGHEYVWREREMGTDAIQRIFDTIGATLTHEKVEEMPPDRAATEASMIGEIMMGHLRYSTTGRSGLSFVHPFLRRNNWRSRCLMMCGNFNMTNVDEIFNSIVQRGQHPRLNSDTIVLLEQLGDALDKENHRLYRMYRDTLRDPALEQTIENEIDVRRVLEATAPAWDGGFVICGATGSGSMFALRDSQGIRPAFYYSNDEIVVVASERPAIQTVMGVDSADVHELLPGQALVVENTGRMNLHQVLEPGANRRCSFERIYFSRASDADIYRERKALGALLAPAVVKAAGGRERLDNTVFSFIPNTAEVAFMGLVQEVNTMMAEDNARQIMELARRGILTAEESMHLCRRKARVEKAVVKDIKLRTFIAEGPTRRDLAAHVYDLTYGVVRQGIDSLVVIDDSIVRGTTLRQSILSMLRRLNPRKIVVASSAPQVRYPDYYGIDMSILGDFIAFQAAVALRRDRGEEGLLKEVYERCLSAVSDGSDSRVNHVKMIYEGLTDQEVSAKIAELVAPEGTDVEIVFQTLDGLHNAVPDHPGDWYFSGDYPTPGGFRLVNRAYIRYYENRPER